MVLQAISSCTWDSQGAASRSFTAPLPLPAVVGTGTDGRQCLIFRTAVSLDAQLNIEWP